MIDLNILIQYSASQTTRLSSSELASRSLVHNTTPKRFTSCTARTRSSSAVYLRPEFSAARGDNENISLVKETYLSGQTGEFAGKHWTQNAEFLLPRNARLRKKSIFSSTDFRVNPRQ